MNKFEQVFSFGHRMSLTGAGLGVSLHSEVPYPGEEWVPCMVRSNLSWLMVTWDPPKDRLTD